MANTSKRPRAILRLDDRFAVWEAFCHRAETARVHFAGKGVGVPFVGASFVGAALTCAVLLVCGPVSLQAAEPFYVELLRDGRMAYDRGDYETAVRDLRLACFGFLEEPELLAEGLVRLALAQAGTEDKTGFEETFRRILEVEERFAAYSRIKLEDGPRQVFEQRVVDWIPDESLAATPFDSLVLAKVEQEVAQLPPRRRVRDLEARIASQPDNLRWPVMLAELHLEAGRFEAAAEWAHHVLDRDPGHEEGACIRGAAWSRRGEWTGALGDLRLCGKTQSEPRYAVALIASHVELGQWAAANQVLEALPEAVQRDPSLTGLARRIARNQPADPPSIAENPTAEAPSDEVATKIAEPLGQARGILARARSADDLNRARELAKHVADANLGSVEAQHLVAEIAYRASRWQEAVTYFKRGGEPGDNQPHLQFYMAVSLYESGDGSAAGRILKRCLPNLQRTAYVESYVEKILASSS